MKRSKITFLLSAIFAVVMLISGCEKIILVEGTTGSSVPQQNSSVSEDEIKAYPLTLNGIEITASPRTVISLTPAYTEILCEMGYKDRLVAVSDYCDYPEAVTALPKAGNSTAPDTDAISRIKPDIVITSSPIVTKDRIALEAQGIKILTIPYPTSIEEFYSIYKFFGLCFEGILSGEDKGNNDCLGIKRLVTSAANTQKRSFIYLSPTFSPAGGDTFENAVLSLYGENCAKSADGYSYPPESLLDNQPEIIYVSSEEQIEQLAYDEIYSQLNAVIDGNIIVTQSKYFERPSGRIKELLSMLNEQLSAMPAVTTPPSQAESDEDAPDEQSE